MSRAQATVEFIILIGFLFLIFLGFAALLQSRFVQVSHDNTQARLQQVASIVITEADLAEGVGDGYSRVFEIPFTIGGLNYSLEIQDNKDLILAFQGDEYVYFLNKVVFGQVDKGRNLIKNTGSLINITNLG